MDNQINKFSEDQQQQLLFMMLVQQHEQIGFMGLGKLANPADNKIEVDLQAAKYAIDTLAMLEKYTQGNLDKELAGYLQQKLSLLRLNYVDEKKASQKSETPNETITEKDVESTTDSTTDPATDSATGPTTGPTTEK